MPYTPEQQRNLPYRDRMVNVGNLTYALQTLVQDYLLVQVRTDPEQRLRYSHLCEAKAALLGCYDDLQQRLVVPYEKRKRLHNGDVWVEELLAQVVVE